MSNFLKSIGIEVGESKAQRERKRALYIQNKAIERAESDHLNKMNALEMSRGSLQDGGMFTVPPSRPLNTYPKESDELAARMAEAEKMTGDYSPSTIENFGGTHKTKINGTYNYMECRCENGRCECKVVRGNDGGGDGGGDGNTITHLNTSQSISGLEIEDNKIKEEFVNIFEYEVKTRNILNFLLILGIIYFVWILCFKKKTNYPLNLRTR